MQAAWMMPNTQCKFTHAHSMHAQTICISKYEACFDQTLHTGTVQEGEADMIAAQW